MGRRFRSAVDRAVAPQPAYDGSALIEHWHPVGSLHPLGHFCRDTDFPCAADAGPCNRTVTMILSLVLVGVDNDPSSRYGEPPIW